MPHWAPFKIYNKLDKIACLLKIINLKERLQNPSIKPQNQQLACISNGVKHLVSPFNLPMPTIFGFPNWSGTGSSVSDS